MADQSRQGTRLFERISFLIVDPNAFMRSVMSNILKVLGARQITQAADGSAAMKIIRETPPDIVLTDWHMSPIDGVELTRLIRTADDSPNHYLPIVMVTSYSERHRVIEARDAGISEFVVKPLSAQSLIDHILEVIERPREFVRTGNYFGPDRRRRRKGTFAGEDRRNALRRQGEPEARPADRQAALSQDEIDTVVAGGAIEKSAGTSAAPPAKKE